LGLISPALPDFDLEDWGRRPYLGRVRLMCEAWAMQGFGAPGVAYLFYVLKLFLYAGGFLAFAVTTRGVGGFGDIGDWWSVPIVFQKAVLWTLLYESLGLGCGSGPLTGRYVPPVTAFVYFLRPGTIRLAPFRWVPLTAGIQRTLVDVALYAAFLGLVVRALVAPEMTRGVIAPIVVVLLVLGLRDKTVFLAARAEHYLLAVFVFLFPGDVLAGSKAIQMALWLGAASSKLNRHFPNVIAVMMSNNPMLRSKRFRKALYRDYPNDMRGSRLAATIGHTATIVEYTFPLVLLFSTGGPLTTVALCVMVAFHLNILTSFPLGVPLEWNVFFIYSGLVLFGVHADVRPWDIDAPALGIVLLICLVVIPVIGNLRPDRISFLPAMRYYAGNWAVSLWLFRPGLLESLDDKLTTAAPSPRRQLERLYGPGAVDLIVSRVQAFRSMHLHGRALNSLLPIAIEDLDDADVRAKGVDAFEIVDGELVAGIALGWNFGEGHLHNEALLAALQQRCAFAPGDVRCIFLESQPAGKPTMRWRIADANTGRRAEGEVEVADLLQLQPWGGA
jgi:hypothetical protein